MKIFENLFILKNKLKTMITEIERKQIKKEVNILFKRIYNIKKIRRKRKITEWLKNHVN